MVFAAEKPMSTQQSNSRAGDLETSRSCSRVTMRLTPDTSTRSPLPSSSSFIAAAMRRLEGPVRATIACAGSGGGAGVERTTRSAKANRPTVQIISTISSKARLFTADPPPGAGP